MIQIKGLSFRYPGAEHAAIRELSLQVRPGSLFGLLGPNGSGKTTLISILTGLLTPAAGSLRIDGRSLPAEVRDVQKFSALVPQEHAFYPRLSVMENLKFFAGVLAIPQAECHARLDEAIAVTGLESFISMRTEHLSGGLKRRLNLAIGLLNRPRLLFLDEPTVGMDPQSRRFILDTIKRINADGTTVLYTSHYMEEVETLCDEIGVLDEGRLLARGTLAQLLGERGGRRLTVTLKAAPTAEQGRAFSAASGHALTGDEFSLAECSEAEFKRVVDLLGAQGLSVSRVKYGYGNLEELFLHLTGRQLRD
ncbi:MAG TPA: ABC transporter ATP-binding protein [Gammaproteobacteria bacterium]|nr:ABC transporter ATP-binding protein [Gammaproteobacteria bacterium]